MIVSDILSKSFYAAAMWDIYSRTSWKRYKWRFILFHRYFTWWNEKLHLISYSLSKEKFLNFAISPRFLPLVRNKSTFAKNTIDITNSRGVPSTVGAINKKAHYKLKSPQQRLSLRGSLTTRHVSLVWRRERSAFLARAILTGEDRLGVFGRASALSAVSIRSSRRRNTEITATITLGTIKHRRRRSSLSRARLPDEIRNPPRVFHYPPSLRVRALPWDSLTIHVGDPDLMSSLDVIDSRLHAETFARAIYSASFITIMLKRVPFPMVGHSPAWLCECVSWMVAERERERERKGKREKESSFSHSRQETYSGFLSPH